MRESKWDYRYRPQHQPSDFLKARYLKYKQNYVCKQIIFTLMLVSILSTLLLFPVSLLADEQLGWPPLEFSSANSFAISATSQTVETPDGAQSIATLPWGEKVDKPYYILEQYGCSVGIPIVDNPIGEAEVKRGIRKDAHIITSKEELDSMGAKIIHESSRPLFSLMLRCLISILPLLVFPLCILSFYGDCIRFHYKCLEVKYRGKA